MKTQEELNNEKEVLKQTHSKIFTLEVKLDDDGMRVATLFLKKPDKKISKMINEVATKLDSYQLCEAFLKATHIGGDELSLVLNDEDALISTEFKIVEIMARREAILKKN